MYISYGCIHEIWKVMVRNEGMGTFNEGYYIKI